MSFMNALQNVPTEQEVLKNQVVHTVVERICLSTSFPRCWTHSGIEAGTETTYASKDLIATGKLKQPLLLTRV